MIYEFNDFYQDPFEIMKIATNLDYPGQVFKDITYPGFSDIQDETKTLARIQELLPDKHITNFKTVFRKGTDYYRLIHSDIEVYQYNAVIYLSIGNNTAFWKHKFTGFTAHYDDPYISYIHEMEGNDPDKWDLVGLTKGDFNSVAIYPSEYYHSIFPFKDKDDRLTQVCFFDMEDKNDKKV